VLTVRVTLTEVLSVADELTLRVNLADPVLFEDTDPLPEDDDVALGDLVTVMVRVDVPLTEAVREVTAVTEEELVPL
jgi:hypothetical protein